MRSTTPHRARGLALPLAAVLAIALAGSGALAPASVWAGATHGPPSKRVTRVLESALARAVATAAAARLRFTPTSHAPRLGATEVALTPRGRPSLRHDERISIPLTLLALPPPAA